LTRIWAFPIEIKQILLDGVFWKLELPLKRQYSFNSIRDIYTHLRPPSFPSYLAAITVISRVKLMEYFIVIFVFEKNVACVKHGTQNT